MTHDIEAMRFNTAISAMMILVKHLGGLEAVPLDAVRSLVLLLSPFAPHLGEELWKRLGDGKTTSLAYVPWPEFDPALVKDDVVEIGVQVNGKLRGTITLRVDADEATARESGPGRAEGARARRGQDGEEVHLREGQDRQLHRRLDGPVTQMTARLASPLAHARRYLLVVVWRVRVSPGVRGGAAGEAAREVVRSLVADAVAADEVASGVREELVRAGALEAGEGYPRVEIEVLRADESSEGHGGRADAPVARGTGVAMVARAWVASSADAPAVADTGDMRAEETIAVDVAAGQPDPRANAFHHADALRAAARRLGHKLGARVLGQPAASEGD